MSNVRIESDPCKPGGADIEALREAIEPLVEGLREEVRQLHEEVRQLRGERSEAAMLSVHESANIAGISERKMRTLIHAGEVPSARIGRRLLVPKTAFKAWLRSKVEEDSRR